jgi:mRNA deadenylase 3'-5' endonuclease subunit Ccr4
MTYNVLRYDTSLNTTANPNKSTNDRYDEAYNTVLFYNPDVVGFQEYCVNYHANMRPELEKNGYTFTVENIFGKD